MALFLIYADKPHLRTEAGINAALVDAADASTALTTAAAVAPAGVGPQLGSWAAVSVATTPALPNGRTVVWFEGVPASLLGMTRGGSPIG